MGFLWVVGAEGTGGEGRGGEGRGGVGGEGKGDGGVKGGEGRERVVRDVMMVGQAGQGW